MYFNCVGAPSPLEVARVNIEAGTGISTELLLNALVSLPPWLPFGLNTDRADSSRTGMGPASARQSSDPPGSDDTHYCAPSRSGSSSGRSRNRRCHRD